MISRTVTCCRECGHLHDDHCDAAVLDYDGQPAMCGCGPTCDPCGGTGDGNISGWADDDGACNHCGGDGKDQL